MLISLFFAVDSNLEVRFFPGTGFLLAAMKLSYSALILLSILLLLNFYNFRKLRNVGPRITRILGLSGGVLIPNCPIYQKKFLLILKRLNKQTYFTCCLIFCRI